jgi:hypothetical protein
VVLGVAALNTQAKKYNEKKRNGKNTKKRLHIFFDETKKAFLGWEDVAELGNFSICEAYIEWCHISRGFPRYRHMLHRIADKISLHHCKWSIFKEQCIEMCQHIYDTAFLEYNKCPLSIVQMVYTKVVLRK